MSNPDDDKPHSYTDLFPLTVAQSLPLAERQALEEKLANGRTAVIESVNYPTGRLKIAERRAGARQKFNALAGLKAQLTSRNIQVGGVLGIGALGVVYELENLEGQKIESAVIRLDPTNVIATLDNPAAIKPVFQESVVDFTATIIPKGRPLDAAMPDTEKCDLVDKSLAVFNAVKRSEYRHDPEFAAGKLPHVTDLDFLKDLGPQQFMMVPGIELPQLADLSSMNKEPVTPKNIMLQSADTYIEAYKRPASVRTDVAPAAVVERMQEQREAVDKKVKADIDAAYINIDSVPVIQSEATGRDVGTPITVGTSRV